MRQPFRRETPDEEDSRNQQKHGQRKDEHGLTRAYTEPHRNSANKRAQRQREQRKRREIRAQTERGARAFGLIDRPELIEPNLHEQPQRENHTQHLR